MAMKINSYQFDSMTGDIPGYGESVEDLSRPGLDGHTFRLNGKRGKSYQLQTLSSYDSSSDALEDIANFSALQGTFAKVEKGAQSVAANIVLDVTCSSPFALGAATNEMKFGVRTSWTLQRAG